MRRFVALLCAAVLAWAPVQAQVVQGPQSAAQLPGAANNTPASAGNLGELISAQVASGSAISISSAASTNITSVSLTPGDWNCWGTLGFIEAAGTTATIILGGISTTSATLATLPAGGAGIYLPYAVPASQQAAMPVGTTQVIVNTTTTVYLVANITFAVSTMTAYGYLGCRRMR